MSFNKLFERLLHNRLSKFFEWNGNLFTNQYGFKRGSTTTLAIFNVLNDFYNTFNKKLYTVALFLDIQKAFDSVDKTILLLKLEKYGIRGLPLKLIDSYLTSRKQYVALNDHESNLSDVIKGVPQGSVLGPLLFNIFIDDISNISNCKTALFADDSIFYVTDNNFDACIAKLRLVVDNISSWLLNNKLIPNTSKTKLMMLTPKIYQVLPVIEFDGNLLEWVDSFKYLGLYIDNKLLFSTHASYINRRMAGLLGVIYSLSKFLPQATLITIYHSIVIPVISYNIVIWGGIANMHLDPIRIKMNKILRIILKVKFDENRIPIMPINHMYKVLNLLKLNDFYKFNLLKFLHFILYNNEVTFMKYFSALLPTHTYDTRNTKINLPEVRLEIEKNFTVFNICNLINDLSDDFLIPQSKNSLKRKFYELTFNSY